MAQGYLKVQVHTGDNALPVGGACVLIKECSGELLYDLVTDANGYTRKVSLYAPDIYHTMDPNDLGPYYARYNVEVLKAKGDVPVIINGVQIFDGETSILPVNNINEPIEIEIPPITGFQVPKFGTPEEPPNYDISGKPDVAIPEYITVHLGRPDSNADNIRVRFVDYIKNTAASEIFPTWPRATIEASVHALVSFALNRVGTGWYRKRGFDFDVTNSAEIDRYFVYGRNIFEKISEIVDSILANVQSFAGVTNQVEPNHEITHTIMTAMPSAYISPPYPETALYEGSRGSNVSLMQDYLNTIAAAYPFIPKQTVDGIFGKDMQNAVFAFQKQFGLIVDGVIGSDTWDAVAEEYNRLVNGQPVSPPYPGNSLKPGASGVDVALMQRYLNAVSTVYTSIPQLVVDGIFGNRTQASVFAFQKQFGLTQDGIIGVSTWIKIVEEYNRIIGSRFMAQVMMMNSIPGKQL